MKVWGNSLGKLLLRKLSPVGSTWSSTRSDCFYGKLAKWPCAIGANFRKLLAAFWRAHSELLLNCLQWVGLGLEHRKNNRHGQSLAIAAWHEKTEKSLFQGWLYSQRGNGCYQRRRNRQFSKDDSIHYRADVPHHLLENIGKSVAEAYLIVRYKSNS